MSSVFNVFKFVLINFKEPVETENVLSMERLPINNDGGQGYGFILYQKELESIPEEIVIHNISDRAQVKDKESSNSKCRSDFRIEHIKTLCNDNCLSSSIFLSV